MYDIVLFLSKNGVWFYLILGGISIYLISKLFNAIAQWRDAPGLRAPTRQPPPGESSALGGVYGNLIGLC
jgi:hypothetical protein